MDIQKQYRRIATAYNILMVTIIGGAIALLAIVWMWYGHRDAQIENALLQIR